MNKGKKVHDTTLSALKHRIESAKKGVKKPSIRREEPSTTLGKFLNVGMEFVAGILAGVAGGLFVDWLCGTSPWGLISLFILGSCAGFLNVYRTLTTLMKKS